ncbi:sporulation protein [Marinicrinis sediminis]|uniref:Sporulation protein n=1 Tax=Marinicrinis sediminis TaxID=1652465 RepID=A0ABW5RBX3_9BACL
MSFFKKVMASVGIGNMEVDTRLERDRLVPGEEVNGVIHIRGGKVDQQVERMNIAVKTEYLRERDDHKFKHSAEIVKYQVADHLLVKAGSNHEIPFSIPLPIETPSSLGRTPIWIQTDLDIDMAVDPQDRDYIEVLPHPYVATILDALNHLGFHLKKTQNEYTGKYGRSLPFIQEYEFVPTGHFRGHLDELEFIFMPQPNGLEFIVEVDRAARGLSGLFAEALDMDETKHRMFVSAEDLEVGPQGVADKLNQFLQSMI